MTHLEIIKTCCNNLLGLDISKKSRKHPYVMGRLIYYKISRELTKHCLQDIGNTVGVDHATVLHHLKNNFEVFITNDNKSIATFLEAKRICERVITHEINFNISDKARILELEKEVEELKTQIEISKIKFTRAIKMSDPTEQQLIETFRQLDHEGKKDALFKIEILNKVRKKLNLKVVS